MTFHNIDRIVAANAQMRTEVQQLQLEAVQQHQTGCKGEGGMPREDMDRWEDGLTVTYPRGTGDSPTGLEEVE